MPVSLLEPAASGPTVQDGPSPNLVTRSSRRGLLVVGDPAATHARCAALVHGLAGEALWVSDSGEPDATRSRDLGALLGRGFTAVIIDAHTGLDPDVLGACHGFVRGGGALIVRLSDTLPPPNPRLAAFPFTPSDVGLRFESRARLLLYAHFERVDDDTPPLLVAPAVEHGTAEQTAVAASLALALTSTSASVLLANRGRGKSSALGMALAAVPHLRSVVTALHRSAVGEVLRFGPASTRWLPIEALLRDVDLAADPPAIIVVDEAATIPVPILQALVARFPDAHLAFSTTVHGYEGTGRGFALRFIPWLEARRTDRPIWRETLNEPIRWAAECPLERSIFKILVLDADLADVADVPPQAAESDESLFVEIVDRQAIVANTPSSERDLSDLFGLLVHAHYRTSPGDLIRLLDAPNLAVHVARYGGRDGRIVAACLVAHEGGLPPDITDALYRGASRILAHALPDALVSHLGRPQAGPLTMVRSVRIATHPQLRRVGLARRLVEHVHASYDVDLFGTLFGASTDLLAFRRSLDYRLVRVSASRNQRTGEPSVMMLRPVSPRAHALVDALTADLAHELPVQLALLESDTLHLSPELAAALSDDLPPVTPRSDAEVTRLVQAWVDGPRTFESMAATLFQFVTNADLGRLDDAARLLLTSRILTRQTWDDTATALGLAHPGLAMRALRRAVAKLLTAI